MLSSGSAEQPTKGNRFRRRIAAFSAVAVVFGMTAATVGSAAAATKIVTGLGSGGGGKLAQQANQIAKTHLTGPKGSGLTRGVTSSTITIGCVYTPQSYAGFEAGIQARLYTANKKGIDGRKIKLLTCKNDGGSVQSTVAATQSLVDQDNVFSVLSLSTFMLPASTDFLNKNQVPYFGFGYFPGFCGSRWGFGWNGCIAGNSIPAPIEELINGPTTATNKAVGLDVPKSRVAMQANVTNGNAGTAPFVAYYNNAGAKVVYAKDDYPTATSGVDDTPYVQAILAAKPDLVYVSLQFSAIGPFVSALRAAGYKGPTVDLIDYIPGLLAQDPSLAATLQTEYVSVEGVPFEENTSYIKRLEKNLAAVGHPKTITNGSFMGYAEATMLVGMLQAVGKNLNTKTFTKTVNGGNYTSYTTIPAGGVGKLIWPAGHYLGNNCAAVVQIKGTQYKVASKYACYPADKVVKK